MQSWRCRYKVQKRENTGRYLQFISVEMDANQGHESERYHPGRVCRMETKAPPEEVNPTDIDSSPVRPFQDSTLPNYKRINLGSDTRLVVICYSSNRELIQVGSHRGP